MYNKTIILKSRPAGQPAGLLARAGRSLCRRRPVSMPASAGLYAGVGRSLCRRRPVSMPVSMPVWAPGALGPTPFRLCRRTLFVFGILGVQKNKYDFFRKIGVLFYDFCYVGQC